MSHPSEHSTGSNVAAVIVIVLLILGLFCGGGLVLLGGLFYTRLESPAPMAPVPATPVPVPPVPVAPPPVVAPMPPPIPVPEAETKAEPDTPTSDLAAPEAKPQ